MISKNLKKRIFTSIILLLLFFLIYNFNPLLVFSLLVLGVLSILEFLNITKKIIKNKIYTYILNSIFLFYVVVFCFVFFFFSSLLQLKVVLFSLLLTCIASDIGGFIFGKTFKGPKLTKISPNKTIVGALGSLIFSSIFFSGAIFYFTKNFNYTFLVIAIVTSIACQIGDLFFSFLKRKAKIKDTGNFLPGHGGILDRLDGIFLGLPIGFISLLLIY